MTFYTEYLMDELMPLAIIKKAMIKGFNKPLKRGDIVGHDGYPPYYIYNGLDMLYEIYCNGHTRNYEISKDSHKNFDLSDGYWGYSMDGFSFRRYHLIGNIFDKNAFIYRERPKFELKKHVLTKVELDIILKELKRA